jgi:hypothetical protein
VNPDKYNIASAVPIPRQAPIFPSQPKKSNKRVTGGEKNAASEVPAKRAKKGQKKNSEAGVASYINLMTAAS